MPILISHDIMKKESSDCMELKEGLIIAPNHIKEKILKQISENHQLINIKIMNKEEFIKNYFITYKNESLYFLMQKFNLKYKTAKKYLDNIYINHQNIKPYFDVLKKENLLIENPYFKQNINHITINGYNDLDPFLLNELKQYDLEIIKEEIGKNQSPIYEFTSQTEELIFIACDIIKKIKEKNISINDIYIAGINSDYNSEFTRIFNLYKIPFTKKPPKLYSTQIVQTFLKNLNQTKNINEALNILKPSDIKNQIIDTINDLNINENIDTISLELITNKMQEITLKQNKETNTVHLIDIDQITDKTKHYYIVGFNQGIIPHIHKDDDIVPDIDKQKLGILTSAQKNEIEKEHIKYLIKSFENLTLTYKLKDTFNTYYPSFIIDELNITPKSSAHIPLNYSNNFNKLKLGILLDNYFNYNEKDENLDILKNTYPNIPYNIYKNDYQNIKKDDLKTYLKNNLTLSYTSLNNYALCPFKFYIKHILKLETYEETFAILIGNLFHQVLSQIYNENFDLKTEYQNFIKPLNLTPKEKFYLNNLYEILKKDIEIIKWQDSHSKYQNHLTEKQITIDKSKDIKITFKGIIDKLNYQTQNNLNKCLIIDYKTGNVSATLDNLNDGLNLQLPSYIYLIKNGLGPNYTVNGFYLQKILNKQALDSKSPEEDFKTSLKLNGYTINDEEEINQIDDTYQNSEIIKGMKLTQKGFYVYSKIITQDQISKLENIVSNNIDKTIDNILNTNFQITPKRINNENISCPYCPFKDLCFVKEDNIKDLKQTKFKDIIGDDENA